MKPKTEITFLFESRPPREGGYIVFKDESQLAYARRQFEEFGRCPHVYLIADGTKRYVGSRFGTNSPLCEYWGSFFTEYVWDKSTKRRHILKVFPGNIDIDIVTKFEREMIDLYDAVVDRNFLNKTRQTDSRARIEAGRRALEEKYPETETNGVSPQAIEARTRAGRRALEEKYPETNGVSPQFIEAGRKALKEKYPETNGAPPQNIEAWTNAAHKFLKEKYPDTNGVPPQNTVAAHKSRMVPVEVKTSNSSTWVYFDTAGSAAHFIGYQGSSAASKILRKLRASPTGEVTLTFHKFRGISIRFPRQQEGDNNE